MKTNREKRQQTEISLLTQLIEIEKHWSNNYENNTDAENTNIKYLRRSIIDILNNEFGHSKTYLYDPVLPDSMPLTLDELELRKIE
jgi:hypothetical protein